MTRIRTTIPRLAIAAVRVADVAARGAVEVAGHSPPYCGYVVCALLDGDLMSRGARRPSMWEGRHAATVR